MSSIEATPLSEPLCPTCSYPASLPGFVLAGEILALCPDPCHPPHCIVQSWEKAVA